MEVKHSPLSIENDTISLKHKHLEEKIHVYTVHGCLLERWQGFVKWVLWDKK